MPNLAGGRPRLLLSLLVALAASATLAAAAGAADSRPANTCRGRTAKSPDDPVQVAYSFHCRRAFASFSIVTTSPVAGFEVTADARKPSGAIDGDVVLGCEGDIPGWGFNCSGGAPGGDTIRSAFEPDGPFCSSRARWKLRTWVLVSDDKGFVDGPFVLTTPKKCKPPKAAKKRS
jgi:hypothetical protein